MIDRRDAVVGLGFAAAFPTMVARGSASGGGGGGYGTGRGGEDPVAITRHGRVRGLREGDVLVFRGVRYGADTRGRRFRRAAPPARWTDVADATRFGFAAPQTAPTEPTSEDCLVLNVWTPAVDAGRRPVMVYLHGGAHSHGSGADPLTDGANLSRRGDVVVVTVNHRLAALGYAYLAALGGPEVADSGNVGNLDIVLALRWVRDNIAAFGGDPARVLLFGQSGGGAKVVTLMAMPEARPLFHRAATMSGQHVTAAGPIHATERAQAWMARAGARTIADLMDAPVERLVAAMAMTDPLEGRGEISFVSTLDHGVLARHPFYPDAPREAAHIPLIVGNTHDETALWIGDLLKRGDTDWENLPARYVANTTKDLAAAHVIRRYRELYPDRTPGQVLLAATTAGRSWPGHLIQAEERAKIAAPAWMYQLDLPSPAAGGVLGAFHTLDIPLVFDNCAQPGSMTGTGTAALDVAGRMADAFVRFAATGDPNGGALPDWRPYTFDRRPTMIFDRKTRMEDDPRRQERLLFAVAPYIKPGG